MRRNFAASLIAIISLMGSTALAKTATIDPAQSSVKWVGKKVTGQHNGTVKVKSGQVEVEGKEIKGGEFQMDMGSIVVEDIKDPEYNGKLVGHLKSDDFFSVEKHPVSTFKITSVKPLKGKAAKSGLTHEVTGDLTIKGIKHAVTFPAAIKVNDNKATAKGKVMIDRTKYDIKFRSGKFFENLGDNLIHDEFVIDLDLVSKL